MISAQDLGRYFEDEVHLTLCNRLSKSINVLREKDVKNIFGANNSSIDHCLISDNYIICIQDKWESRPACISKINHFLMGLQNIAKKNTHLQCIGIYLSKLPVSGPSHEALNSSDIECINIHCIDDEKFDSIIEDLFIFIHHRGFFSYDSEGCIIMR